MTMNAFINMTEDQRRAVCTETGEQLKLSEVAVEKDFWVCWVLKKLFSLPVWGLRLTFKGGTSLSKGWGLIERFSEDIDIVISREDIGFGGANSPENAPSGKKKRKKFKELTEKCQYCIREEIAPELENAINSEIPDHLTWELIHDPDDPGGQTLLFHYPSVFRDQAVYLRRAVKIEMGARSDIDPAESIWIEPYINRGYPELFTDSFEVRAVSPKRTFWEKAMLLHEETFRPPESKKGRRFLARHYYDIYCLIEAGIADQAAHDLDLFYHIREHRMIYFKQNWTDYSTLVPGQIRLVPSHQHMQGWIMDYADMIKEMFYGEIPGFDQIIAAVQQFQDSFNEASG